MLRPLTGAYPVCGVVFAISAPSDEGVAVLGSVCANANFGRRWAFLLESNDPCPKRTKSRTGSSSSIAAYGASQNRVSAKSSSRKLGFRRTDPRELWREVEAIRGR